MVEAFRVSWLEDYARGDLDYRRPPGPTVQRLRRMRRRWCGVIVSVFSLLFLIFVVGFGFVLFTLPALPLVAERPAAKVVADDVKPSSAQRFFEPDKISAEKGANK